MGEYFTSKDMDSLIYYQVPKILLVGEKYKNMNLNAVKVYIILIDRIKLSMMNNWKDEKGRYYVRLGIDKGADLLGMAPSTFKRAKKELAEMDLLEEVREGLNKSNKLFPKQLEYTEEDVYTLNNEVDDLLEEEEENANKKDKQRKGQNEPSKKGQNEPSKSAQGKGQNEPSGKGQNEPSEENKRTGQNEPTKKVKMSQQEGSKSATIKNDSSENDPSENKDIVNSVNNVDSLSEQEKLEREEIAFKLIRKYMLDGLSKTTGLKAYYEVKDNLKIYDFEKYFTSVLDTIMINVNVKRNSYDIEEGIEFVEDDGILFAFKRDEFLDS